MNAETLTDVQCDQEEVSLQEEESLHENVIEQEPKSFKGHMQDCGYS